VTEAAPLRESNKVLLQERDSRSSVSQIIPRARSLSLSLSLSFSLCRSFSVSSGSREIATVVFVILPLARCGAK